MDSVLGAPLRLLNTGMTNQQTLRETFDKAVAAVTPVPTITAPHRVSFPLDPSIPGHQEQIDDISAWALSTDRVGHSRRTVRAAQGEVIFDFEKAVDAVHCKLRFD